MGHGCDCGLRRLYFSGACVPVSALPGKSGPGTRLDIGKAFADGDHYNAGILLSEEYQLL